MVNSKVHNRVVRGSSPRREGDLRQGGSEKGDPKKKSRLSDFNVTLR